MGNKADSIHHSRWSNLLCLATCYCHPILGQMLEKQTLAELFGQSIRFFQSIITPSSSLYNEICMMIKISEALGLTMDNPTVGATVTPSSQA